MTRSYYKPHSAFINGHYVSSASAEMKTSFELVQCFCSCPLPLQSMLDEWYHEQAFFCIVDDTINNWIEVHDDCCPNAKKGSFRRHVTKEELQEYRNNK